MAFDHNVFQQRYRTNFQQTGQVINDADSYGVRVVATPPAAGAVQWKAVGVHHLTPDENRGQHNAFVDILDEDGRPLRDPNLRAGWSWEGRRPDEDAPPQPLDKSLNEAAGNVPLFKGAQLEVWISDPNTASDRVTRLSTDHPDEPTPDGELFNSIGHHSYYVVFQRVRSTGADGGDTGDGGETGVTYICQRAEHLGTGEVRVYHVIVGDWGNVQFVSRPR